MSVARLAEMTSGDTAFLLPCGVSMMLSGHFMRRPCCSRRAARACPERRRASDVSGCGRFRVGKVWLVGTFLRHAAAVLRGVLPTDASVVSLFFRSFSRVRRFGGVRQKRRGRQKNGVDAGRASGRPEFLRRKRGVVVSSVSFRRAGQRLFEESVHPYMDIFPQRR